MERVGEVEEEDPIAVEVTVVKLLIREDNEGTIEKCRNWDNLFKIFSY